MSTPTSEQNALQEDEQAIIAWLKQNTIPVQHIEAGNGFADLQPLKEILRGVRVVGLGEATHGTREFFQLKHRLLEFLVTEMGFTAFALEASYAACQPINEFVLHGKGDRATVLTGNGYVAWDMEEFAEMLDWLRTYNQRVPEGKKVRFYGLDSKFNQIGREAILNYLRKVAPDSVPAAGSIFADLAGEEEQWPWRIDKEALEKLLPQLQRVIDQLIANRAEYIGKSSAAEFEDALQYIQVMKQWLISNTESLLPPSRSRVSMRSIYMAENLVYLIERTGPEAKFVVWEHNGHVSVEPIVWSGEPTLGSCLREKYGQEYFACGLEFNQGSYLSRTKRPDNRAGDLKEVALPPAPAGSLPWYLSRTNIDALVLDLRAPVDNPVIEHWLHTPRIVQWAYWSYEQGWHYSELSIMDNYDAIVFVDRTTATRPTANALKAAANGERF